MYVLGRHICLTQSSDFVIHKEFRILNRGSYMAARGYEFYLRVVKDTFSTKFLRKTQLF